MVRSPRRGQGGRDRLDGRGGYRFGGGQRGGVLVGPVRSGGARDRGTHRVAGRGQAHRPAVLNPPDRAGRADRGRVAGRWEQLSDRHQADHAGPGRRSGPRAVGTGRRLVVDRPPDGPGRARCHHQPGQPGGGGADVAAGGPGRRRGARPARAGPPAHPRLLEQTRGPGCLVRGHRRRIRGEQGHRRGTGRPDADPDPRCLCARACLPPVAGGGAVPDVLHRLAQRVQLPCHIRPAGRSRQWPPAGRRRRHRQVLPAFRKSVAAVVHDPQHRAAFRVQHRRPGQLRRGDRRWQRRRLCRVHHQGLLLTRRPQLRRHHRPGPPNSRRSAPQPPLPHHRRHSLQRGNPGRWPRYLRHLAIRAAIVSATDNATPQPPTSPGDFAESQQAGLAAMLGLANAAPVRPPVPALRPPVPALRPPVPAPRIPVSAAPPPQPPARLPAAVPHAGRERTVPGKLHRFTHSPRLPLLCILAVQAALSLRLVWSNTAFMDEALYLWAGHVEIAHLLYGSVIPAFPTYFSGAPVIYPVLGAIADAYGGLALARLLSLAFMLASTTLLYSVTGRLFGRRAAIGAAAVFAVLGPVQVLGAFATFDAMSVFLLALATWLVTRARGPSSELLLVAAGLVMALADAAKYASALWNPVIIALAALTAGQSGVFRPAMRAVRLTGYLLGALAIT